MAYVVRYKKNFKYLILIDATIKKSTDMWGYLH